MKVGFFTETYLPQLNGVSLTLAFEKKKLEEKKHQVFVFAPNVPGYKEKDKGVVRLNSFKVLNAEPEQKVALPIPNKTFRKMLAVKLDIVHAHGGGFFSFLGYQLALAKGYPYVLTYHTFLAKYVHYFFIKNKLVMSKIATVGSKVACNLADIVIVPSAKMKNILESYGVNKKIVVVPNPIDLVKYTKKESGYLHDKLQLSSQAKILLTVCRIGKEKNIDFLLRTFKLVLKKEKNTYLIVVGNGPEKENLEKYTHKLGLNERVIFTGYIEGEDMAKVYSDAEVFLFASTSETQGMVVPEAAACGLPLVVVADEAFVGAIEEGVNGYSVEEKETSFARKILDLLENDSKRARFGRESERLIRRNFSVSKIIGQLVEVYEEAIVIRSQNPRISKRIQGRLQPVLGMFGLVKKLEKRLLQ